MNFDQVRETVDDVIAAMFATDPDERLFIREWWPGASCEHVAVAVAAVLEDRGLGVWTFIVAARPGEPNGDAWLEWYNSERAVQFSIDPTLHQFTEWEEPFVGEGKHQLRVFSPSVAGKGLSGTGRTSELTDRSSAS
ncbi:hypothetical protein [Microbacterium sp.]|uniref:hypothetical protein n=1 Tax=Microbacterium sp. TaxID=51671 RepID=UPI0035AED9A1